MDVYTHGHAESVLRSHIWRTAENSAAYLTPHLQPGMSLLDVGCGPGPISADFARLVAPGRVLAIDPAAEVIRTATASADSASNPNLTFAVGDIFAVADQLPPGAGSFDVVHAHQVLQHLSDPVAALREMRRLARPGGLIAVRDADYAAMSWYPKLPALDRWMDLYQRIARFNGGEPDAGRRLLQWAHDAGFNQVTATASVWCFSAPGQREWWGGLWADRMRDSALAVQAVTGGFATAGDLRAIARGWRQWAEDPGGWFTVVHGELLCPA